MFDPETIEFLEGGCALVVGTVASDGAPFVSRGWGLTVVEPEEDRIELLVDAAEAVALGNIDSTRRVALTAGDVPTLHSVQLKGHVTGVRPAGDADKVAVDRFCEAFFDDVIATDGTDRRLLERLVPLEFVVCDVSVDEFYNQTPGPGAGSAVARGES